MMSEDLFEFFVVGGTEKGKDSLERPYAHSRDNVEVRSLARLAPPAQDSRSEGPSRSASGDDKNLFGAFSELFFEFLVLR